MALQKTVATPPAYIYSGVKQSAWGQVAEFTDPVRELKPALKGVMSHL